LALSLLVVGVALVVGAEITPATSVTNAPSSGLVVSGTYFLVPTTISISISSLNSSAHLIVAPLGNDLSVGQALVNVSVVSKDIVTFPATVRGYYVVEFESVSSAPISAGYTISEGGVPADLVLYGAILAVFGGAALSYSLLIDGRRMKKSS
jgi:hypothetical protein